MWRSIRGIPRSDHSPTAKELNFPGVYLLYSRTTNVGYVGSALLLKARSDIHWRALFHKTHERPELQEAYNTYGVDDLEFRILETMPEITDAFNKKLLRCEGKWIIKLTPHIELCNNQTPKKGRLMLDGRLEPVERQSVTRYHLSMNPEKIYEQIELWNQFREAYEASLRENH